MSNYDAPPNSVGWHILEGYPWWPVYICDPTKLRPNLHLLGSGHKGALRKARDFPKDYGLVYFFGSHNFCLVRLKKGMTLRPWDCADKEKFLKGVPNHLVKKKAQLDDLLIAIQEAEDYLSMPEDIRLPPHMVPSDLDPSLDPPPPIERMEVDEGDEDDEDAQDDDGDGDADGDASGDEDDERRSKKSKEKSKKKKSSSSSSKDKKAVTSKSSSKDKDKDKKASKSKKDKSDTKDKKSAKKDKDAGEDKDKDKKRKTVSGDEPVGDAGVKATPSKVAKKDKAADVKSEIGAAATAAASTKASKSSKSKSEKAATAGGEALSGEALSTVLEKEIKWILANCQFEEMTTKTVRKLLEKRLQMDLRHHKGAIKEGVARVIASMEDGTDAAMTEAGPTDDVAVKAEASVAAAEPAAAADAEPAPSSEVADDSVTPDAQTSASADEPMKSDEPTPSEEPAAAPSPAAKSSDEPSDAKSEDPDASVVQHLQNAEHELGLALNEEPKLVVALRALQLQVPTVDRAVLTKSALLPTLVTLRAHEATSVSSLVAAIASQWAADDLVPAPKPIREEDILAMKNTLENAETSHDDVLACLQKLAKMRLQMSHLKNTGIARVVAGLRQHANDKVSIAAINLRKSWIQLTKSTSDNKSDADRVKTLEGLNRILEQSDSAEGERSHLAVLEKLQGMTLSTQDIIKSKIGVVVSKLRKSPNEKVAKAAAQLRKKWKTEAAA